MATVGLICEGPSIRRGDVGGALAFNDLVIVQIDTDVCEQPGFDVHRREDGRELTEAELAERCAARLRREIVEHDPDADLTRVVFATCVNELECWLLLHLSDRKPKTTGCLQAADTVLRKQTLAAKDVRAYEAAAKDLRHRKGLDPLRGRSPSLDALLADLAAKLAG